MIGNPRFSDLKFERPIVARHNGAVTIRSGHLAERPKRRGPCCRSHRLLCPRFFPPARLAHHRCCSGSWQEKRLLRRQPPRRIAKWGMCSRNDRTHSGGCDRFTFSNMNNVRPSSKLALIKPQQAADSSPGRMTTLEIRSAARTTNRGAIENGCFVLIEDSHSKVARHLHRRGFLNSYISVQHLGRSGDSRRRHPIEKGSV